MPRRTSPGQARIQDVALAASVSVMTVSRAMRGVEGVSEATRRRVLAVARDLAYVPNSNARALALTNANLIGIALPTLFNDVFADVLSGMRATFERAGYAMIVETTDYDPDRELAFAERTLAWRPAAIILTGCDHRAALRTRLVREGVPTLEIWDVVDAPIDLCVGIDHYAAGRDLARHVVALGYRAPAFVGAPAGLDVRADHRVDGIAEVFRAAGASALRRISVEGTNPFAVGAGGIRALAGDARDVVFFQTDHLAFGGMMAAERAGMRVPDDIGIVGFNGLDLTEVLPRPLTTMITPRRQMGLVGACNVLARMNRAKVAAVTCLRTTLVPGATTRAR